MTADEQRILDRMGDVICAAHLDGLDAGAAIERATDVVTDEFGPQAVLGMLASLKKLGDERGWKRSSNGS